MRRVGVLASLTSVTLLAASAPAAEAPAVADRLNLGVVALEARIGGDRVRSSGTVLNAEEGLVLTSAHTVWGATSLRVASALGVLHGRIVARAPCDDLALVEIQPRLPGLVSLEPAPDGPPARSELLAAVGRRRAAPDIGLGSLLRIPARVVATGERRKLHPRLRPLRDAIRLDGPLVPDATGGPIVDRAGRVVAIAQVARLPRARAGDAAVPWATVRARLDELRLGRRRAYVGWAEQYRCANGLHAYAEALHPAYERRDARLNAPVPATRLPGTEALDG